ncbi:MAG: hypothetical protein H6623_01455 [Bdellovibrionaceae bacterium]|nr:hypothetical protein [Pseudobdellovibrionaceae bacterium]
MKHIFFLFLNILFLGACGSPRSHAVTPTPGDKKLSPTALSFPKLRYSVTSQWLNGPVGNIHINNTLLVVVKDEFGQATSLPDTMTLQFYATMPSMGHPMDDAGFFEKIETGVYINKSIRYNMPGEWRNELWILNDKLETTDKISWFEQF